MESVKKLKEMQQAKKVVKMPIPFILTKDDNIKANSLKNAGLILEHDKVLIHTFAFNEFTHEIAVINDIPELRVQKGRMIDDYTPLIMRYIEDVYGVLFNRNIIEMAVVNEARKHTYNPVKDYFNACHQVWDGIKRAPDFLPTYLGADKSEITTLQTKLFFVGAVAKAFEPTTKFDFVLDLVGGQGAGKTTLLKKMAVDWYTDQFTDFKDKDNYSNMLRALIVNDDEMTATNNSDFANLKKFISMEKLEFRKSYGRNSELYDKNFVMARTTNELTYLKDKTGERRFLPILVDKERQVKHPVTELTQDDVIQLWGEFTDYYFDGFDFGITDYQNKILEKNRSKFMYVDEIEEQIEIFLDAYKRDFVSSNQIAKFLGIADLIKNRKIAKKIKYIMDNENEWVYTNYPKRGYKRK
ncbi:VapE domain-containing protein [Latilactobacillus sakei]|uniref:VapE domain-containing protein n=1 Tax=Latilactobacillus sakei TaxID=1599 RepID=UPI000B9D75F8|nr:VapE domain-containing protein [Latilactobacillus sakei]BAX67871.1 virulence-associated E family protein [Latilactobacillus sakei]